MSYHDVICTCERSPTKHANDRTCDTNRSSVVFVRVCLFSVFFSLVYFFFFQSVAKSEIQHNTKIPFNFQRQPISITLIYCCCLSLPMTLNRNIRWYGITNVHTSSITYASACHRPEATASQATELYKHVCDTCTLHPLCATLRPAPVLRTMTRCFFFARVFRRRLFLPWIAYV